MPPSISLSRMKLEVSERETLGDHFFIKIKIAEQKRGRGNNASTNYLVAGKFPFLDPCVRDPSNTAGTWVCHPRAGRFHTHINSQVMLGNQSVALKQIRTGILINVSAQVVCNCVYHSCIHKGCKISSTKILIFIKETLSPANWSRR